MVKLQEKGRLDAFELVAMMILSIISLFIFSSCAAQNLVNIVLNFVLVTKLSCFMTLSVFLRLKSSYSGGDTVLGGHLRRIISLL